MEVGLRRRFGAIGLAAKVDGVEVHLEDLRLAVLAGKRDGERRLPQLALQRVGSVRTEVELLDQLLGNRASTFDQAKVNEVIESGASDRAEVDAAVLVISLV